MNLESFAKNILWGLAVVFVIMLIVALGIGMHVMLNPTTCATWSSRFENIWPKSDPVIYSKTCANCGECTESTPGKGDWSCKNCGNCTKEKFSVNRIQDIERVQWDQPTNSEPTASWPGHEGFYNADNDDARIIHDTVLNSVISDDVKQNHNAFIANTLTSQPIPGASHMGEKDNYNPPNKWSGLKRDALHKQLGAMGDARQVQSETREQVADFAYRGNSYLL